MHSFQGKKVSFHFNGDYSGDIIITKKNTEEEFVIPSSDMLTFAQNIMYNLFEEQIENVEDEYDD